MTPNAPLERILSTLADRAGLIFSPVRRAEVEHAALSLAGDRGSQSLDSIALKLETGELDVLPLVDQLTVGETYFFRQPEQFEFLRSTVLPGLAQSAIGERLRFWSAGCSSGEEAYSLAILLEQEGLREQTDVIGTDISSGALARAAAASYKEWSFRGCSPEFMGRYFERRGDRHVLRPSLRRAVSFRRLNLAGDETEWQISAPGGVHVIFFRNVLIYFDEPAVRMVARRLYESLVPGGWLVTGAADPLLSRYAPFEVITDEAGLFCRRPASVAARDVMTASSQPSVRSKPPVSAPPPAPAWRERRVPEASAPNGVSAEAPRPLAPGDNADAEVLLLRAAIGTSPPAELRAVAAAMVERHPRAVQLQFMNAVILMNQQRDEEALDALRRVLYLRRDLALVHFLMAVLLRRTGRTDEMGRSLRNAARICAGRPAHEPVPLGDGEVYGSLCSTIASYAGLLESTAAGGTQ